MRVLALVGCVVVSAAAVALPDGDPDWSTRYEVRFERDGDGLARAEVSAVLTWNGGRGMRPESVELGMADDYEDEAGAGMIRVVSCRAPVAVE